MTLGNSLGQIFPDNRCRLYTVYTNLGGAVVSIKVAIYELPFVNSSIFERPETCCDRLFYSRLPYQQVVRGIVS